MDVFNIGFGGEGGLKKRCPRLKLSWNPKEVSFFSVLQSFPIIFILGCSYKFNFFTT